MSQYIYPTYSEQQYAIKERHRAQALLVDLRDLLAGDCPEHLRAPIQALVLTFQNFLNDDRTTALKISPPFFMHMGEFWLNKVKEHLENRKNKKIKEVALIAAARQRLEFFDSASDDLRKRAHPFCSAFRRHLAGKKARVFPKSEYEIVLDSVGFLRETENLLPNQTVFRRPICPVRETGIAA